VEQKTKDTFVGGKGYDLWLLWNAVQADTRWDDPQNPRFIPVPAKVLSPPFLH